MRRRVALVLILVLATAFFLGAHAYLASRLILEPGWPEPLRSALLVALVLLAGSVALHPLESRLRQPWRRLLAWPGALWMGFAFLLLWLLGASDLLLWLTGDVASAAAGAPRPEGAAPRAAAVAGIALVAGSLALREGLRPPRLRRVEIGLPRWPRALDGYRIVQISDLHIGPILGRRFVAALVRRVNEREPDLVVATGDLVDGGVAQVGDEVAPFAGLRARHGAFFVTGNHDHYSGARAWVERARELGFQVLRNRCVALGEGAASFDLLGVDDHRGHPLVQGESEDLPRALAGRRPGRAAILLAHDPSTFRAAQHADIDLQLSGHTHGGQIWPFGYLVRLVVPWVAGLYERRGRRLYVSRGTGFWGPPMRLLAPAEITEIVLHRKESR